MRAIVSRMDILAVEKPKLKSEVLPIRIEVDVLRKLTTIAKKRGLRASAAARLILTDFVDKHPDFNGRKSL